jgi:hypothetical protein
MNNKKRWYRINIYDMRIEPVNYVWKDTKEFVYHDLIHPRTYIAKKADTHEFILDTYENVAEHALEIIVTKLRKIKEQSLNLESHYSRIEATL